MQEPLTPSAWRVLRGNVAVFLGLFLALYFAIPMVDQIGKAFRALWPSIDTRGELPNYAGQDWAKRHFAEIQLLQTDFMSYFGWRRRPFQGQTITVEPGLQIRRTPQTTTTPGAPSVYFFGGSTMWGAGSDDARTIPALYQRAAGGVVLNFGESGWVAHQSLNQLMKLYSEGQRPDVVVFYDGVNDVSHKCRAETDFWADDRQRQIRQALAYRPTELGYYLRPILSLAGLAAGALETRETRRNLDCDQNAAKAELIATQLIADWQIAAALVRAHGGRFYAYLQPVSYFSQTRLQHLRLSKPMGAQYQTLYPIFRRQMAAAGIGADLSAVLDADAPIYIDFCHISPNGNTLVAARIARDVAAR